MTIYIFSRPVHSGKTTELLAWSKARTDVSGIAMPDHSGTRFFEDLLSGERWPATTDDKAGVVPVGPYRFSQKAFDAATRRLRVPENGGWLVIDEIGKLELDDKGFGPALKTVLRQEPGLDFNLLLVVRESLLKAVCAGFGIDKALVVQHLDAL